jgi:hypothetical protein
MVCFGGVGGFLLILRFKFLFRAEIETLFSALLGMNQAAF